MYEYTKEDGQLMMAEGAAKREAESATRDLRVRLDRAEGIIADLVRLIENSCEHHRSAEAIRRHWKIKGGKLRGY